MELYWWMSALLVALRSIGSVLKICCFVLRLAPVGAKVFTANSEYSIMVDWDPFLLSHHYSQLADAFSGIYASAEPFPHIYFDNVFPGNVIEAAAGEFPNHNLEDAAVERGWGAWLDKGNKNSYLKYFLRDEELMGPACQALIGHLRSRMFIAFLETLTGIPHLLSDPYLHGGGLHQIGRGGHLSVHADFNRRETDGLWRRVNVFIYLNENWDESYGGHLELWNANVTRCVEKILPVINRLVVFSTSASSMHGHPDPLQCPEDRFRKSIAAYYYASAAPAGEGATASYTTTNFKERPGEIWTV